MPCGLAHDRTSNAEHPKGQKRLTACIRLNRDRVVGLSPLLMNMKDKTILLIEDNPDDEALTLRALKRNNIMNEVIVARDGAEALDYLFGTGAHAGRDLTVMPQVILLDLKLPKVDGLEVLRQLRANELTRLLPVVILTTSNEDRDRTNGYGLGANSYVRKPIDFGQFIDAVRQLGLYWLVLNEPAPVAKRG